MLEKLLHVCRGLQHRFKEGNNPFQILTRLLEEGGELAQQVNHFEGMGVKREKLGEPNRYALASEILGVLGCAFQIADYYGVFPEMEESLEEMYQRLKAEGHILN